MKNLQRHEQLALQKQRGVALVASLIILLLMTVVGLSIMNGNGFFEKSAGNTRDKQRAFQAAQDALLYGEWWLSYGGGNLNFQTTCTTATTSPTTLQVCGGTGADPGPSTANLANIKWYTKYTPPFMQIQTSAANAASGGVTDSTVTTSDVIYAQNPGIYINCITCGTTLPSGVTVYRVTAIGYGGIGGTNGTVAIVQSVVASAGPVATLPPNYGSF